MPLNIAKYSLIICLSIVLVAMDAIVRADETLHMGVFPRRNASVTLKMFTPLADYLSKQLGRKVIVETTRTFPQFWENVLARKYDIVHYNQLHYILSHKGVGYDVIAKNEELGQSTLAPAIIVRKDSGIHSLADLQGKKIAFGGGKLAMIAYVGNKLLLMEHGLLDKDYQSIFAINPPNATFSVYYNKADAAAVGDVAMEVKIVKQRIDTGKLTILATGKKQPHLPWAVKAVMPPGLKNDIQRLMVGLSDTPEGKVILRQAGLSNLLPATDTEYDASRDTYRTYKRLLKKQSHHVETPENQ